MFAVMNTTIAATAATSAAAAATNRHSSLSATSAPLPAHLNSGSSSSSSYTSMRDDPLPFLEAQRPLLRHRHRHRRPDSAAAAAEEEEEEAFLVAQLRLLANAAADRAEMHAILAIQRDNWNKLFQPTLSSASMAATVLAALNSAMATSADGLLLSLGAPAALLNAGTAVMMCVINHFQPSQLAEEQRSAARLFRKLGNEIEYALHVGPDFRQPSAALLRHCRRRLEALDKAFPMPLTPGGLEKFPSQIRPPMLISPLALPAPVAMEMEPNSSGWSSEMEAELRGIAGLVGAPEVGTYTGWAQNVVKLNKGLAIAGPMLAGAAALLNMAVVGGGSAGIGHGHLAGMAAMCSALAAFVGSLSNDMQLGMVVELYRNAAGHYAYVEASIRETLSAPVAERGHATLFRQCVGYETGHFPADTAQQLGDDHRKHRQ